MNRYFIVPVSIFFFIVIFFVLYFQFYDDEWKYFFKPSKKTIPEYCKDYGVSFSNNFEEKLEYIIENYDIYKVQMKSYPFNAETMCIEFYDLFIDLLKKKNLDPKNSQHLIGRFFILKNKFLKLFRDQIYLNIKSKVIFYLRSLFSNG